MIFIDENTVKSLLTWENSIEATEEALKCASDGRAVTGERNFIPILKTGKWMAPMPGYLDHEKFGGWACKMLINCPQNASYNKPTLPVFNATVYYMDMSTGMLKAVMGGINISNYRTAAASVIATKYLFDGISGSGKILTVLGAGEQARAHAEAFFHVFDFSEVRIWNRTPSKSKELTDLLNQKFPKKIFKFFEDNEHAVRGADVIITATAPGDQPILKTEWVKQGSHINAIGVSTGNAAYQELETELYKNANIFTDNRATALKSLGILNLPDVNLQGEIGEVILGKIEKPRKGRVTIFQSFGIPAQDCAMARMIFDAYETRIPKQ